MSNYEDINFINKKLDYLRNKLDFLECYRDYSKRDEQIDKNIANINTDIKDIKKEISKNESELNTLLNLQNAKNPLDKYLNKIILGDCLDYLPKIPNNSIDAVISDIPYGINLDDWDVLHSNTNSALLGSSPAQEGKSGFKRRGKPINGWNKEDRNINKEYENWVYKWVQFIFPLMKEGAPLFIFGGRRTISSAITAFEKAGFLLKDILAWEKSNAHHRSQDIFKVLIKRGNSYIVSDNMIKNMMKINDLNILAEEIEDIKGIKFAKWNLLINKLKEYNEPIVKKYQYEILEWSLDDEEVKEQITKWKGWKLGNLAPYYEPIAWFMKPYDSVVTLTDNVIKNEVGAMNMNIAKINGKDPKNILPFDFRIDEIKNKVHDAQKPIELIKYLINLTTIENQIILDPFVGSGTTAVACKELNRKFISFEINEEYHKIAVNRLERTSFNIEDNKQITLFNDGLKMD